MRASTEHPDWAALERSARGWLRRRAPAHLIDDLTQETLLRVHRTLPTDVRSAEAWTVRAAHSVLVDALRRADTVPTEELDEHLRGALQPLALSDPDDRPDAGLDADADATLDRTIAQCLAPALAALPAEQRDAIRLVDEEGLSSAQAAAAAGLSAPGLRARLQRARARVRATAGQCCEFEIDGRGRPIGLHPRSPGGCSCGCGAR